MLQLSDTHLFGEMNATLLGLNTEASLLAILEDIKALNTTFDFILLTGDLSQDASAAAYERLSRHVKGFACPSFWLPGNHDNFDLMQAHLKGEWMHAAKVITAGNWQVLLLNSQVPGKVHGYINEEQIAFLEEHLCQAQQKHTLIALHHHPIPMDCDWIDNIGVKNQDEFWAVLSRFSNVKGVLWGHVHQQLDVCKNTIQCMSTPSTCVQFKPNSCDFAADDIGPGYRILELQSDGVIKTEVRRIHDPELKVDFSIKGY